MDVYLNLLQMSHIQVGEIQNYPVMYIPEKNLVFCKNTVCKVSDIEQIVYKSNLVRNYIEDKNLSIIKDGASIYFGCLTTTINNISEIRDNIKTIKRNAR